MRPIIVFFAALLIFSVSAQPLFAQRGAGSRPGDSTSNDDGSTDETDPSLELGEVPRELEETRCPEVL